MHLVGDALDAHAALKLALALRVNLTCAAALELDGGAQLVRLSLARLWSQLGVELDIVDEPRAVAIKVREDELDVVSAVVKAKRAQRVTKLVLVDGARVVAVPRAEEVDDLWRLL